VSAKCWDAGEMIIFGGMCGAGDVRHVTKHLFAASASRHCSGSGALLPRGERESALIVPSNGGRVG
jgi:hypothetical protein